LLSDGLLVLFVTWITGCHACSPLVVVTDSAYHTTWIPSYGSFTSVDYTPFYDHVVLPITVTRCSCSHLLFVLRSSRCSTGIHDFALFYTLFVVVTIIFLDLRRSTFIWYILMFTVFWFLNQIKMKKNKKSIDAIWYWWWNHVLFYSTFYLTIYSHSSILAFWPLFIVWPIYYSVCDTVSLLLYSYLTYYCIEIKKNQKIGK